MSTRAQAALEFLLNYGWAILVVLVVIGALAYFGVLNPSRLVPERCAIAIPFGCSDQVLGTDGMLLSISNNGRNNIVVSSVTVSSPMLGAPCTGAPVGSNVIPMGEKRSITAPCYTYSVNKKGSFTFDMTYTKLGSILQHIASGSFVAEPQGVSVEQLCTGSGSSCYSGGTASVSYHSCNELHSAAPQFGDGVYQLSFGNTYCDMTTAGGGWTLTGLIERASDGGYADNYWFRNSGKWTDATFTHPSMTSITYSDYNNDAKSATWTNLGGTSLMMQCSGVPGVYGYADIGSFSSLSNFFTTSAALPVTSNGQGELSGSITLNHVQARIYWPSGASFGDLARDADGICDAFIFVR